MRKQQSLLDLLKNELAFLESGGYRNGQIFSWRPPLIFEGSPTCLNHLNPERESPCADCRLVELAPPAKRQMRAACRFVPLDPDGRNLDVLYRTATQQEIEAAVKQWLIDKIWELEVEEAVNPLAAGAGDC